MRLRIHTVVLLCVLACVYGRPQFASRIPEFDGRSLADQDGVFRHDSLQINRKRDSVPSNNYLRYEAVLIDGIVRVDDILFIEALLCQQSSTGATVTVVKSSEENLLWGNETVLVGGAEWNCTQNSQGYPVPFTARIQSRYPGTKQETYIVEFIPMSDLFKHLELELRTEQVDAKPVENWNAQSNAKDLVEIPSTTPRNRNKSPLRTTSQRTTQKRTLEPTFLLPLANDMFFEDEMIDITWENIPGATLILRFYNQSDLVTSSPEIPVSDGIYSTFIDSTWPADGAYFIEMAYNCDENSVCPDLLYSEYFSVNYYPDITFNAPERGRLFTPRHNITVSVEIDSAIPGPFYLSIWQTVDNASDVMRFDTTFNQPTFDTEVTVNSSWASSNSYYVMVEYGCQDEWCYYQTSEYFSVIENDSINSLQFDEPNQGAEYFGGDSLPIKLVGNFSEDTIVYLIITQRRLGWDKDMNWYYLTYTSGLEEFYTEIPVDSSWVASRQYYLSAFWGCDEDFEICTGYAESPEFAVNNYQQLTLNSLQSEYMPGDSVVLSWNTPEQYTDMNVQICYHVPFLPDTCTSLGVFDSSEGSVSWTADLAIASAVWDNYFYIQYNCQWASFWCSSIQSTDFRIRDEIDVLDWNWDGDNDQVEIPDRQFFHEDCASITQDFCTIEGNEVTPSCELCNMEDFDTALDITCHDCYAKIAVTVNEMKINISWFSLREFTTNLTINATSEMNLDAQFTMDYQTDTEVPLTDRIPIYALPPIWIAGFQFYFGLYGTVTLVSTFSIEGNVDAQVTAMAGAAYDVYYSSNADDYVTTSRAPYFDVTQFTMSMQASASLEISIVPEVQLDLFNTQVLYINAVPYIRLDLQGAIPPFDALPPGSVPQNSASLHLFADYCSTDHWLEFDISCGAVWNGGANWGSVYSNGDWLIEEFVLASGCLWPAQSSQVSSSVPVRFLPSDYYSYNLHSESFQTAMVFDIAASLQIPMGAIAEVSLSSSNDSEGYMVFDVAFSDTDTLVAQELSSLFLTMISDGSSAFFNPSRYVTKSAVVAEEPSPTPTPTASISATPSPSTVPSISISPSIVPSLEPSSSVTATPSISASATPSITPSISASPSPVQIGITPSSIPFTPSASGSTSPSISMTPSTSASSSASPTSSATPSHSSSPSTSISPSVTPSSSPSMSPSTSSVPSLSPSASPVTDSNNSNDSNTTAIVVGVLVVGVGVAAVVAGVVIIVRKKMRAHRSFNVMHDEL